MAENRTLHWAPESEGRGGVAADVFDGPALGAAVARFLAAGAEDPPNLPMLAEIGDRALGFASGTVLDHPDKPRALLAKAP